ncbi:MAG: hypothetical protein LBT01_00695 [Spirochaetaceae bacterium]|jgi:hypothetical protein|nr:hypothetical protein [Spirochaetaceae bacterium]
MKAKKSVYIETTIPSYATAQPSFNALNMVRKTQTEIFWKIRDRFRLWISQEVIEEISKGDKEAAKRRIEFVKGIELLSEPEGIDVLAVTYQALLDIPDRAKRDCFHLVYCVLSRIDYLLSWNCTHLGPSAQDKARVYNDKHGLWTPLLVTPEILYAMEEEKP